MIHDDVREIDALGLARQINETMVSKYAAPALTCDQQSALADGLADVSYFLIKATEMDQASTAKSVILGLEEMASAVQKVRALFDERTPKHSVSPEARRKAANAVNARRDARQLLWNTEREHLQPGAAIRPFESLTERWFNDADEVASVIKEAIQRAKTGGVPRADFEFSTTTHDELIGRKLPRLFKEHFPKLKFGQNAVNAADNRLGPGFQFITDVCGAFGIIVTPEGIASALKRAARAHRPG